MFLAAVAVWVVSPELATDRRESFVVEGRLRYIDGDRLMIGCGKPEPCIETLVRDERLQRHAWSLQGKKLRLRVERVAACGEQSDQVACVRSIDGTALRIVEWLDQR